MELTQSSVWKNAPELALPDVPAIFSDSETLWLAYRSHRGFAIVKFTDVIDHRLSPINDEGLGEHPYAEAGLKFYEFNEIFGSAEVVKWSALHARHWVITFKDNMLDVVARDVVVAATEMEASSATEALLRFLDRER